MRAGIIEAWGELTLRNVSFSSKHVYRTPDRKHKVEWRAFGRSSETKPGNTKRMSQFGFRDIAERVELTLASISKDIS